MVDLRICYMIFLGTPKLCGGVHLIFFKVSFEKHPTCVSSKFCEILLINMLSSL